MNAFSPDDFGDMSDLLIALGLVDGGGFNSDWLRDPEGHLKTILANPEQRQALLDFVATLRDGTVERDPDGRQWIPLVSESLQPGLAIHFFLIVDDAPPAEVHLFLGVRFESQPPHLSSLSSLMFPLFRARKQGGGTPPSGGPELIGSPGGHIAVTSEITLSASPASPGEAGLRAVGLRLSVPTMAGDGDPQIGLTLRGLQLPGETTPRDLALSLSDPEALAEAGLDLILGLVQAQIGATAPLTELARLLGLAGDAAIPDLPVQDLAARGVDALADWLAALLSDMAARAAWLNALATLLGNGATVMAEGVSLPLGSAALRIGLTAVPGGAGRPVVTLSVGFGFRDGTTDLALGADLVRIDLGSGAAIAVPRLRAEARFDLSAVTLANGDVSVAEFVAGFGLDAQRRPLLVLELVDCTIFQTHHARLDLTNPEAMAATAAAAATGALSDLLAQLGPPGDLIAVALGWAAPNGAAPGYPVIDPISFLGDPVGRLRDHWRDVLDNHAGDLLAVLGDLRALITGDATPGAVTGSGTPDDPWLLPLVAGLKLALWRDAVGRLVIALDLLKSVDTLGERCTVIETRLNAAIVALDFTGAGGASFLPEITLRGLGRARGGGRLSSDQGPLRVSVDHLGLRARYRADGGLSMGLEAPDPRLYLNNLRLPLDLPPLDGDIASAIAAMTDAQWEAIERLAVLLVDQLDSDWLRDVIDALGWRRAAPVMGRPAPGRLALSDLVADAQGAIRRWLAQLLADAESDLSTRLQPFARFLSGRGEAGFHVSGRGTILDPWQVALNVPGLPALAVWREPDAPLPRPDALLSEALRRWRPGLPGLTPGAIAEAIASEFPAISGSFGRGLSGAALSQGLLALAARWQGGDGMLRPPAGPIAGATLHLVENSNAVGLMQGLDPASVLGAAPETLIRLHLRSAAAPLPQGVDPARLLDLREAGRDPLAFTPLPNAPGVWDILLAPRADAALASGDPDGSLGQIARLRHGLSLIAARPGATVLADPACGHAAWMALAQMPSGPDRLICVGLPVDPDQLPAAPDPLGAEAELLRRLGELIPDLDPADPDDADLALGRALLEVWQGAQAIPPEALSLPAGWTGALRAGLELHLVYGVMAGAAVQRALTAIAAAGLSLQAQRRDDLRAGQQIRSASVGALLPLNSTVSAGALVSEGQLLVEMLGCDLDLTQTPPEIDSRAERRIIAGLELRREGGWLLGGPLAGIKPAALELRALEIALRLGVGPGSTLDRCEITLHGLRIHDRAFPRLVLDPSLPEGDLGIDGQAAPSTGEISQILSQLLAELAESGDPILAHLTEALRLAGVLGPTGGFDPLSLSNWIDDPAARLAEMRTNPALSARLQALISSVIAPHSALSFDASSGRLSLSLSGPTGVPALPEWALDAEISANTSAISGGGSLRIGAASGTHLALDFAPLTLRLGLDAQDARALGGLPPSLRLWPNPELTGLGRAGLPMLSAAALSAMLDGLRRSDDAARPVIDAALTALGLLQPAPSVGERVVVPALVFIDPVAWLHGSGVMGAGAGGLNPARVIAVMEALRPLVGVSGAAGLWQIAPGLAIRARDQGALVLDLTLDPSQFLPGSDINFGGSFGLRLPANARPVPEIALFVGLAGGAAPDRRALHLGVTGSDLRLFLRPNAGADLEIYPDPAGLTQLATAGLVAALPMVLDAIVATGSDAGNLLADIGDATLLRSGGSFDAAALAAWASDPAGTLASRWPALLSSGLARLDPAMPGGVQITQPGGAVRIAIANAGLPGTTVAVLFNPAPFFVELSVQASALPFLQAADVTLRFDGSGLSRLATTLGPAEIPLQDGIVLRPVFTIEVGSAVAAPFVAAGLAVDGANSNALLLRYDFTAGRFEGGFGANTPEEIAAGIMHFAIDLLGAFIVRIDAVEDLLDTAIGASDLRGLLTGVVLRPGGGLDPEFFRVIRNPGESADQLRDSKLARLMTLIDNIAALNPSITVDGQLTVTLTRSSGVVGLSLGLADRLAIVSGDIAVWLENDSRWIIGAPPAGITLGLLRIGGGTLSLAPSLSVDGVGLRIGRANARLIDSPLALGSIAFHVFARLSDSEMLGGAQVQLSEIGAAIGGAQGGNPVAQGMLAETNDGDAALAPAFSPAFSIQTRPAAQGGGVAFRFSAGEGEGPWWLPIRKQFGPIYIDQVGLGVQEQNDALQSISLLFDGNVSIAGLQAAVDDLSLTHILNAPGGIFDAASWRVDLAGLAVSADMSGVTLAGGLRKFGTNPDVEYIGMLSARFATYGLSIYGGYASVDDGGGRFTAFFAYGAVVGPIGGAPAFFLTGIGGGFGINREVVPPTDLGRFGEFAMIAALDPAYTPSSDLMDEMDKVRLSFPVRRDRFWFAAGISFTSFALVDGIAVVAVEFGGGFELSIFGLARMALPRPQVALVSIELGLIARFSTEEGVIWIQAQLTDNSWLFHQSARLTGGFAYVSWFKGPNRGQFVLTLGGYHPDFHREGYPVVPRLGFNWKVSKNISIKAESYFALTSEAVMAGGLFAASAKFGPAYANLSFGGNAIVYFDPFQYQADARASISAGIRIKTWLGTIRLSFNLGAEIEVRGPEFHGYARVEVGPIDIKVRFGNSTPVPAPLLSWVEFATKYLELAPGNRARALSAIAGRGALPPASADGEEPGTADGSEAHPFDVLSEFELSLTSTVPLTQILRPGTSAQDLFPSRALGLAPMGHAVDRVRLTLSLKGADNIERLGDLDRITLEIRPAGAFPIGVWGLAPDPDHKKLPKGDVIAATEGLNLRFAPSFNLPIGPFSVAQIESHARKPLPLRAVGTLRNRLSAEAQAQRALIAQMSAKQMSLITQGWATQELSTTGRRGWRRARPVPMRVGLLSERIVGTSQAGRKKKLGQPLRRTDRVVFGAVRVRGVMTQNLRVATRNVTRAETTVSERIASTGEIARAAPPRLSQVSAALEQRVAATLLRSTEAQPRRAATVLARMSQPETSARLAGHSVGAGRALRADRAVIDGIAAMIGDGRQRPRRGGPAPRDLNAGEIAVFDLPGDRASSRFADAGALKLRGLARLVVMGPDGRVVQNLYPAPSETRLPRGARGFALLAGAAPEGDDIAGWMGHVELAYLGHSQARCRGGFLRAEGASRSLAGRRAGIGWIAAHELIAQSALVETRFDVRAECLAVMLEGWVDETDLAGMALTLSGAKQAKATPLLVPYDGKTLILHALSEVDKAGFAARLGGRIAERLDGMMAARMTPERLIARILGETLDLDLEAQAGGPAAAEGVRAQWRAPKDLDPDEQ